jgi:type IV secretory pathway TraG/TraD family ATPase VirD4
MGIHNGYGIHYFLIIQSPNQLTDIYGRDHSFLAHCRNTILYAPGEVESGKIVTEIIGKESIWKASTSNSGSRFSMGLDNLSVSGQEQERNLINADEVMKLPPDQLVLLTQGRPPYLGKKCVYYEDERFKKRLLPAAFTTREAAVALCQGNQERIQGGHWFDLSAAALATDDNGRDIDTSKINWNKPADDGGGDTGSAAIAGDWGDEPEAVHPGNTDVEIY